MSLAGPQVTVASLEGLLLSAAVEVPGTRTVFEGLPTAEEISEWTPEERAEVKLWAEAVYRWGEPGRWVGHVVPEVPEVLARRA